MFFTYSQESKKEARWSGRKDACPAPYTPRKQILFWKAYVILHWAVPSLMSFSQLLEFLTLYSYLMITGTLLFVASFKWPCLFHFIFPIFSSFTYHTGSPTSQGMNMAGSQTHYRNSWVTQKGGCWASQSCPSPRRQQAADTFSRRLKRSRFLKEEHVSPDCSIIFALAPNPLKFSVSKAITISL